ncbi:MAG: putative PurR-regulated permease PerM [Candidatus Paceibacteria bacterium]|jgi:predicted PurR-regulated permease PerM
MATKKNSTISINITTSAILKILIWVAVVAAVFALKDLVLVVMTSIVIASFVGSAATASEKYKLGRTLSVVIIYALSIGVLAGVFYLFVPILIVESANVVNILAEYLPDSDTMNGFKDSILSAAQGVTNLSSGNLGGLVSSSSGVVQNVSTNFFSAISGIFGGLANLILIVVISFYLSIEKGGIAHFLRIVVPLSHENYAIDLWNRSQKKIALWMQGQLVLGLLIGVLTYLGLSILGVKYALMLALVAGIMELIPFGIILAAIPAISFGYLDGGLTMGFLVAGFYLIVQQFENYLIAPLVVQKVTGISPLVVILAVLIGVQLAGFWGLILAIPVAVVLMEFASDVEKDKVVAKTTKEAIKLAKKASS